MVEKLSEDGIGVAAISADPPADSRALVSRLRLTGLPLLSDPDLATIVEWGVAMKGNDLAVPSTFVVGRDGTIRWAYVGSDQSDRPPMAEIVAQARSAR